MIEIDGSSGEGGGQILRTSLSLSVLTRKPFRIFNIRKLRQKPGLMPQHLSAVIAAKEICNGRVEGDVRGSTELMFTPGEVIPGDYFFDIGTAGSTSLLLQTLIPPLLFAKAKSHISLAGGTHVPFSPPYEYLEQVYIPMLNKAGAGIRIGIERYGFYPRGGGRIFAEITPAKRLVFSNLLEPGKIRSVTGISGVANLPLSIAERQKGAAAESLAAKGFRADIKYTDVPAIGQGTFIFLKPEDSNRICGFSALGERGKKAEIVGREAAQAFLDFTACRSCLDHHIADQIVLYLGLSDGPSEFTTSSISSHLVTNLWAITKFLDIETSVNGRTGSPGTVSIRPSGKTSTDSFI